jgi:nucleoside-diphosphate-sugar epimerase
MNGLCMLESEAVARSAPFPTTIVRFAGIYGPTRTRLLDTVYNGTAELTHAPNYTNRIHRDDCAGFIAHLLAARTPAPLYLGTDDDPADRSEVLCWLAERLGVAMPNFAERGASRDANKRCSNRLLRDSGYALIHSNYKSGYAEMVEEYLRTRI